jgi:hypothetical protein
MTDRELIRALVAEAVPRILTAVGDIRVTDPRAPMELDTTFRVKVQRLRIRLQGLEEQLGRALESTPPGPSPWELEDVPSQTLNEVMEESSRRASHFQRRLSDMLPRIPSQPPGPSISTPRKTGPGGRRAAVRA